ncbi:type 1 glutamine amidotransferase [Ferrimicrobium acidiphilum]|uniref:type 1 glutamine amidotransferase n=1 Tax=Ferrimicrobium acidiphilum TaxID=121039 RepID=UPI0023F4FD24|nr:hypothetical protein [Ferrimicrobium acidiphilum]
MTVRIISLFPDVLGTYGDQGNARILAHLVELAGRVPELVSVGINDEVPTDGDIYLLGGGEDGPQALAARRLAEGSPLHRVVEQERPILAVCAGYQVLGRSFAVGESTLPGLGLLPVDSLRAPGRMVGEVLGTPLIGVRQSLITGFENHGAMTILDEGCQPLAKVHEGNGNGQDGYDGIVYGPIVASYLHGPILARNPGIALWLLDRIGIASEEVPGSHWALYAERAHAKAGALWRGKH